MKKRQLFIWVLFVVLIEKEASAYIEPTIGTFLFQNAYILINAFFILIFYRPIRFFFGRFFQKKNDHLKK
ncbi:MAG: hypothetical protein HY390_02415 [Deltaproteobacteria bacterium]|nr:hypothetical protein [Deltaproteobacteria bacterium]